MAFSFFRWLFQKQGDAPRAVTADEFFNLYTDVYIRELAFLSCVNLSANLISKCEFKTFSNGSEVKGREYYLWNISPNQNQNSSAFLHKLIYQLFQNREALVIENNNQIYVADSFEKKEYALYNNTFSQVTIGDFTFNRTFSMPEVMYFELSEKNMRIIVDGLYESYGRLISYGMKGYKKSRGEKGTLELDAQMAGDKKFQDTYEAIKNDGFKKFAEAENAVMPLYKGMKYESVASKTYSSDSTRDIRAMIDDVTDFTARGFGIPPQLLNGSVQDVDSVTDQLLTFHADPLADNLAEEINRKRYSIAEFSKGNYLKIDTSAIKHIDLLGAATGIDKLIGSGVVCINDIRGLLGQPLIDEPWAWQHFITKNYSTVADLLNSLEGGETK
ncbi:MAG: phage portal protein [Oscillospiraceae bacterium]